MNTDNILWMADARKAFQKTEGSVKLTARLDCFDGFSRRYELYAPALPEDREFVLEYLRAWIYNMLDMVSGSRLVIHVPDGNAPLLALTNETVERFYDESLPQNRVIRIARRLCAACDLPEPQVLVLEGEDEDPAPGAPVYESTLARTLRSAVERAGKGFYCGIDVGGTDIKVIASLDGKIETLLEYDWNPASFGSAEETIGPILELAKQASKGRPFDGIGVSYPDIVINDRLAGGETPKTSGIKANTALSYENELKKLGELKTRLAPLCVPGAPIHIINDGHIAAFTAAAEIGYRNPEALKDGIVAYALGTDLGTGYVSPDGTVPPFPTESYAMMTDLGSRSDKALPPEDLRSAVTPTPGLPSMTRYVGQESAFRYAWALKPSLLDGFVEKDGGIVKMIRQPDMRKPCLEALTQAAQDGDAEAYEIFRRAGRAFGAVLAETDVLLAPRTRQRYLFGRFVKKQACFDAIREGCREMAPDIELLRADEDMAETPLMKDLAKDPDHTVAQFGQAVGVIYYALCLEP